MPALSAGGSCGTPRWQEVGLRRQWIVVLRDLPAAGMRWDGQIPAAVMQDPAAGAVAPLESMRSDLDWQGSLVCKGDVYRLCGHWRFSEARHCSRCNAPFEAELAGDCDADFRLATGMPDEDTATQLPSPGELNLVDVLREDIWLAWPVDVACRPDCLGLCPVCGCNRNQGECHCERGDADHPLAALGRIKFD